MILAGLLLVCRSVVVVKLLLMAELRQVLGDRPPPLLRLGAHQMKHEGSYAAAPHHQAH
jgi:hypothetical protein